MNTISRLAEIQSIIREKTGYIATVAGGAVRDILNGIEVRDVDVFIEKSRDEENYNDSSHTEYTADIVARAFGGRDSMVTTSLIGYEASSPGDTYATFDLTSTEGEAINLIFVSNTDEALNEFPDTISRVWLDTAGNVVTSADYLAALANKVVLHTLDETEGSRGARRLSKLAAKFPDYTFVRVPSLERIEL